MQKNKEKRYGGRRGGSSVRSVKSSGFGPAARGFDTRALRRHFCSPRWENLLLTGSSAVPSVASLGLSAAGFLGDGVLPDGSLSQASGGHKHRMSRA